MKLTNHRNLFNGDCNIYANSPQMLQPGGRAVNARLIHDFVDLLADSGVDTFLVNPNAQIAWFPSKVWPTILDGYTRDDPKFFLGHLRGLDSEEYETFLRHCIKINNFHLDFVEAGVDWFAETTIACRQRGISPWASIRMNDLHGTYNPEGSYMNCPLYKHPAYRLIGTLPNIKDGVWSTSGGLNYAKRKVRDYMFELIREVVEDYDYEGLELDWQRSAVCCNPVASQQEIDAMIDWTADIRALTERRAAKTGKPYPLGLRIPPSLCYLRDQGLDVKTIARKGLIDFLGLSNTLQTAWDIPYDQLRMQVGDEIAFFGVLESGPNWVFGHNPHTQAQGMRWLSGSRPLLYGNAAGKLALGADGIEIFNFHSADWTEYCKAEKAGRAETEMNSEYGALPIIADLESLRGQTKQYAFSSMDPMYWLSVSETPAQVPVFLEPDWRRAFRLPMCAEPTDRNLELVIQVAFEKKEIVPELGVCFNGCWPNFNGQPTEELVLPSGPFSHLLPEYQALNFTFPVEEILEGWNEIVVCNECRPPQYPWTPEERQTKSVRIVSVELAVRKKQNAE